MISKPKPVFAALACVLVVAATSTSCGDFFPSSNAIVSITLSPTNGVVKPGSTTQFNATGTLGNNQTQDVTSQVNWTSSNNSFATISQAGVATGVAVGSVTITAKSSNATATATLLVSNVTSIAIQPTSATVNAGGTFQLKAVDQNNNDVSSQVTWSTSDSSVATVSNTGLVSGVTVSFTAVTITATLGTFTATSSITVQ
jgi:uncharacterized protein YjdB